MANPERRYYLAFLFAPEYGTRLHCTHCYFGNLPRETVEEIIKKVDLFFGMFGPITMAPVLFDEPNCFADGVRVLVSRDLRPFERLSALRHYFADNRMISTKWAFRPHVTTPDVQRIEWPFFRYALMVSGQVIHEWPIYRGEV